MTEEETNPLIERIARTLHKHWWQQTEGRLDGDPPPWECYPGGYRALWHGQAAAVIEALDLGYTSARLVNLTGGADMLLYEVEGQWTEAGGAR